LLEAGTVTNVTDLYSAIVGPPPLDWDATTLGPPPESVCDVDCRPSVSGRKVLVSAAVVAVVVVWVTRRRDSVFVCRDLIPDSLIIKIRNALSRKKPIQFQTDLMFRDEAICILRQIQTTHPVSFARGFDQSFS
jgi:hypothetical protein